MAHRSITLPINGMHCASCQATIETALGAVSWAPPLSRFRAVYAERAASGARGL